MHYPKLTPGARTKPAVAPSGSAADKVVIALQKHGDKTSSITWTPAPGVTAESLASALSKKGIADVQVISASTAPSLSTGTVTPFTATACAYGTARSLTCPPVHWANNGYSHPQVYFNDYTGANWPVDQAVYSWNQANGIDSLYSHTCAHASGTHCVNVYDSDYGDTKWTGKSFAQFDGAGNFIDTAEYTELNDHYGRTPAGYRNTACHELGHDLGLAHNVQDYSCMWSASHDNGTNQLPDSDDLNMLASIYSVAH